MTTITTNWKTLTASSWGGRLVSEQLLNLKELAEILSPLCYMMTLVEDLLPLEFLYFVHCVSLQQDQNVVDQFRTDLVENDVKAY